MKISFMLFVAILSLLVSLTLALPRPPIQGKVCYESFDFFSKFYFIFSNDLFDSL
jgi:hypothetical protein